MYGYTFFKLVSFNLTVLEDSIIVVHQDIIILL